MPEKLASKLKRARKMLNLSQTQAAGAWGIPISTLTKWEQEVATPRGFALTQINAFLEGILADTKSPSPKKRG